ncbi:MAG TPA: hypothetical protein VMM81_07405, partial [Acidimicrobiia bacterium]|nr:hypothetical protein [Acidimicrobiia bacterium]
MNDRGSVPLTLAVLLFGSVVMLGLAVDLARVAAAWRQASHTASTAAEAGAGWIDESAARLDRLVLNTGRAREAALAVATAPHRSAKVAATSTRVCVRVTVPVPVSI